MTIQVFNFNQNQVRLQSIDNEIYFCLTDILPILGLQNRALSKFNLNEKGVAKLSTPTQGGKQELVFINEPNLYRVIFRSNKEEAVVFQNWVFEEVLPTIRKTGSYTKETQNTYISYTPKTHEVEDDVLHTLFNLLFLAEAQAEQLRTLETALQGTALKLSPTAYSLHSETSFVLGLKTNRLKALLTTLATENAEWKKTLGHFNRLHVTAKNKQHRLAIR